MDLTQLLNKIDSLMQNNKNPKVRASVVNELLKDVINNAMQDNTIWDLFDGTNLQKTGNPPVANLGSVGKTYFVISDGTFDGTAVTKGMLVQGYISDPVLNTPAFQIIYSPPKLIGTPFYLAGFNADGDLAETFKIKDIDGLDSIDKDDRTLIDTAESLSIDWENRTLVGTAGSSSIDWGNRTLIGTAGSASIDWGNRTLIDTASITAIDFEQRQLVNSDGDVVCEWGKPNDFVITANILVLANNNTAGDSPANVASMGITNHIGSGGNYLTNPQKWFRFSTGVTNYLVPGYEFTP